MDKETLSHLFDRYYRGTNTKQTDAGSGLGMVIAQQLIQLHEGDISLKSDIGKGTKISIDMKNQNHSSFTDHHTLGRSV